MWYGYFIVVQMLDVVICVKVICKFVVFQMFVLFDSVYLLVSSIQWNGICEVFYVVVWICGEFLEYLQELYYILEVMLWFKVIILLGYIQVVYVQNVVKLYVNILQQKEQVGEVEGVQVVIQFMVDWLFQFVQSVDLEVQEWVFCILQLVKYIQKFQVKDVFVVEEVSVFFVGELNLVVFKVQKKVLVFEGLDLDVWINELFLDSELEDERFRVVFYEEEQWCFKYWLFEVDEEELVWC